MDKFTKVRNIGKGNMGACALARNNEDGKYYVIKQVDLTRMSKKERQQSLNEARLLSSLRHPNIINYVDSFLAKRSDHLCIVMEFADGGDLCSRVKKNYGVNFRESLVLDWLIQIALSLNYVHHRKILHRDVKSQNVFLTSDNVVKLGDFGIARTLANTFDQAKTFVGTPYYLSPELILERPYDHRSDVWAVGVVLYEMMALKHPFNANDMKGLMQRILKAQYDPLPMMYSTEMRNIVPRLLMKDPEQRIRLDELLELPIVHQRLLEWLKGDVVPKGYLDSMVKQRLLPESVMRVVEAATDSSTAPLQTPPNLSTPSVRSDNTANKLPDVPRFGGNYAGGTSGGSPSNGNVEQNRSGAHGSSGTTPSGIPSINNAHTNLPNIGKTTTSASEPQLHIPSIGLPARNGNTPMLEKLSSLQTSSSVTTGGAYPAVSSSQRYNSNDTPGVILSPKNQLKNVQRPLAGSSDNSTSSFSSYSRVPATARESQPKTNNLDNFYQQLNYYQQGGRYVPRYPHTAAAGSGNYNPQSDRSSVYSTAQPSTARRNSPPRNYTQDGYLNPRYRPVPLSSSSSGNGGGAPSSKQTDIKALLQKAAMERAQRRLGEVK